MQDRGERPSLEAASLVPAALTLIPETWKRGLAAVATVPCFTIAGDRLL